MYRAKKDGVFMPLVTRAVEFIVADNRVQVPFCWAGSIPGITDPHVLTRCRGGNRRWSKISITSHGLIKICRTEANKEDMAIL